MTTTIAPALGAAPLFTQQGTGTTPGYAALDVRRAGNGALQEGVYGTPTLVTAGGVSNVAAADFMVTQRNAGASQTVDINMPAGGFAYVQGDTVNGQGLYTVPVHSANINEVVAGADATNPRVDQVILEVLDNVLDASGNNLARVRVLTGTPSGTATLTSRAGAAALPGSALLLADVLVPATSSSVPNSNIRDRRKWARGAFWGSSLTTGNQTTANTSLTAMTGNLARLECSGAPLRVTFFAIASDSTSGTQINSGLMLDGAAGVGGQGWFANPGAGTGGEIGFEAVIPAITAGSHQFQPGWSVGLGTGTMFVNASNPAVFVIEELARSNAPNNAVTSG